MEHSAGPPDAADHPPARALDAPLPDLIDLCLQRDRGRLRARLRRLGKDDRPALRELRAQVRRSIDAAERRRRAIPEVRFPEELPVSARREEIARAIATHPAVVVCGETGSGKTTQLPKILLSMGLGATGLIGHTQPRRLAARTVAARIAQELGSPLGRDVGFKIRFTDQTTHDSYIKLMTDGVLLAETQSDPWLTQYDAIIIDEAHERSVNIDFLLGHLRRVMARRRDLRVIVTSATIDPERFAEHFAVDGRPAPIVEVSGRAYPVEVVYRPWTARPGEEPEDAESVIADAVEEVRGRGPGDVLVFLSGEREIRDAAEVLRERFKDQLEVLPLYARLAGAEQMRVFSPSSRRRVVLATNVAETSLTVPGIRYVVDPGLARLSRYNPRSRVTGLPIEAVSRASADQRKGRCGRLGPGVCVRLYSEEDYQSRPAFTEPEILRTNLAGVVLRLAAMGLGRAEEFPFIDPPERRQVADAVDTLVELGAMDSSGALTALGRDLGRLPIDPRTGRMLLAASGEGCLSEVLVIASALSIQDPRERPSDKRDQADAAHAPFQDPDSDFLGLLKLWRFYHEQSAALSHRALRRLCADRFLSANRMREWVDIRRQLHEMMADLGHRVGPAVGDASAPAHAPADAVHRALLTGLLSNVARKEDDSREYKGMRGSKLTIHPGSGVSGRGARWIMAAELVRTTKLYARMVAQVNPQWVERLGAHLVERTHSEPFWDRPRARVTAFERVTLFGLELAARREVDYSRVNPAAARTVFIRHALVEMDYDSAAPFMAHNRGLIEEVRRLEGKARRSDLLRDPVERDRFFDARIPADVASGRQFEAWRRTAEKGQPDLLHMRLEDVLAEPPREVTPEAFPDRIPIAGVQSPVVYRLEPGSKTDGMTVTVPLWSVGGLDTRRLDWTVPGRVREKVAEMVRGLPKSARKGLGSAEEFAARALRGVEFGEGDLREIVARQLSIETGVEVPPSVFAPEGVPEHLRMNLRVVGSRGEEVWMGREPEAARRELASRADRAFDQAARSPLDRDGMTSWECGDLPERAERSVGGYSLVGYPTFVEQAGRDGPTVGVRLVRDAHTAREGLTRGCARLFLIRHRSETRSWCAAHPALERILVLASPLGPPGQTRQEVIDLAAARAMVGDGDPPRTLRGFDAACDRGFREFADRLDEVAGVVMSVLEARQALALVLEPEPASVFKAAVEDVRAQVGGLVYAGLVGRTPWPWLTHVPRYLRGAMTRLQKLRGGGVKRDAEAQAMVSPLIARWAGRRREHLDRGVRDVELDRHRWLLEELRVVTFAPELGSSVAMSEKRINQHWATVSA